MKKYTMFLNETVSDKKLITNTIKELNLILKTVKSDKYKDSIEEKVSDIYYTDREDEFYIDFTYKVGKLDLYLESEITERTLDKKSLSLGFLNSEYSETFYYGGISDNISDPKIKSLEKSIMSELENIFYELLERKPSILDKIDDEY